MTPTLNKNGREIPTSAIVKARLPLRRMEVKSSSRPTRNRKKRRPILATDSSIGVLHDGNSRCTNCLLRPSAEGPSKIPP